MHAISLGLHNYYIITKSSHKRHDIGRLPKTMLEKMSARGLKAQQRKNFIVSYARVCLWNIVPYQLYDMAKSLAKVIEIMLKRPYHKARSG